MKKKYKKLAPHSVTYESGDDQKAVVLAKLGLSNFAIRGRTDLTDSQITYRLHKAKVLEENERGYRVDFRNGSSPLVKQLIADLSGVLAEEVKRSICPKIIHPTPETVKVVR